MSVMERERKKRVMKEKDMGPYIQDGSQSTRRNGSDRHVLPFWNHGNGKLTRNHPQWWTTFFFFFFFS